MFELWLYAYQTKARNPGKTVIAAMNPVLDHLSHCTKFLILEVIQVIRGHYQVKHCICCYCCIPWIPIFHLICIKPQLKQGQQNVKHWIHCCNCIPGISSLPLDEQSLENSIFFFLGSSDSESLENISLVASIREEQSLDSGSSSDSERF